MSEGSAVDPNSVNFIDIATDIAAEVTEKDKAYGSAFDKCENYLNILYPEGIRPEQYQVMLMLVRDFDKNMRIVNAPDAFGESPFRDKIGYALLGERSRRRRIIQAKSDPTKKG